MLNLDSFTTNGFSLRFANRNDGQRTVIHNARASLKITDDLGNDYSFAGMNARIGEDSVGSLIADHLTLIVAGELHPRASMLTVEVSDMARLVEGLQWDIEIP